MAGSTSRTPWYRSPLAWFAALMVAGAGAAGWFGTGPAGSAAPPTGPSVTIAVAVPRRTPPPVGTIDPGGLPTRVVVPRAGIDAPIAEVGVISEGGRLIYETAWHSAGHNLDSALPGQPGNVVLTGHVSVADKRNMAAFSTLDRITTGDIVQVYSGSRVYNYRVSRVMIVPPDDLRVLRSDQASIVTLITCTHDLQNRLVVIGTLV